MAVVVGAVVVVLMVATFGFLGTMLVVVVVVVVLGRVEAGEATVGVSGAMLMVTACLGFCLGFGFGRSVVAYLGYGTTEIC